MRNLSGKIVAFIFFLFYYCSTYAQTKATDTLLQGFSTPPNSAKPRVWWHWMNGNVTKEGITKDMEWMKRVGIGGMQMFEASLGTPRIIQKPVIFNTPEWKDAVHHAAAEATRLDLELTLSAAGGWSQTGGPFVKPEEAMKKVVWSDTVVNGNQKFSGKLTEPPSGNGTFLDAAKGGMSINPAMPGKFYKDFSVIAYRLPDDEVRMMDMHPIITTSSNADIAPVTDGKLDKAIKIKVTAGTETAWIQFEFAQPFKTDAISIAAGAVGAGFIAPQATGEVLASADGKNYYSLLTFPGAVHRPSPERTYTFNETTARFYKVEFKPIIKDGYDITAAFNFLGGPPKAPQEYSVSEIQLYNTARVNQWEDKAGYGLMYEYKSVPTPETTNAIDTKNVIDLTAQMKADGGLEWNVPAGKWAILRMGYSLTGQTNGPAPPELTGFEADKMSKKYMTSYLDNYLKPYMDAIGNLYGEKGLQYLLVDSWEANLQNWTDEMLADFKKRNGYDATPFLPVLTGRVIGSAEISDRFLWDYRNTISDLIADNHYSTIADYLHKKGLKLYGEAIGAALGTMGEGLKSKGRVDIPMGEFWTETDSKFREEHPADILEAASAAHIYNKTLVASESFTDIARPFGPPSFLKYLADYYMALGVNRFVIHTSVHQPLDDKKPGFTLAIFGQHYTRNNTWAEQSVAWNTYLARCSYLLQQGKSANDIAYFIGEDAPAVSKFWEKLKPEVPEGYKFDLVNAEVILTRMTVKDGFLILPDGVSYKMLVLPDNTDKMTLPLLQKIQELVEAGAIISGPKPTASPGLTNYPAADDEVQKIAAALWGATNGGSFTVNGYGKGKVYWGKSIKEVMNSLSVGEDMAYTKPHLNTKINFIHRKTQDADIYFVANQQHQNEPVQLRFRIGDKVPMLWYADKGTTAAVSYKIENGFTTIPFGFDPYGSVFVVFSEKATRNSLEISKPQTKLLQSLTGKWQVNFPPLFNNTTSTTFDSLQSWSTLKDSTLRYYSGTATYTKTFTVAKTTGQRLLLDLGDVKEIAEVSVNDKALGILWKTPFIVDITEAVKTGSNKLEIKVTNLWNNRMEGDKNLPEGKRYTFATNNIFGMSASAPGVNLIASGLLGPVKIIAETKK